MSSSGIWRSIWQRGLGNPNPPRFARFSSTCTRARVCSRQTRKWITGRRRRWPDTESPRIRIHGPERTRISLLQLQHLRLDRDPRGRPAGDRSRPTGRHPGLLRSGLGDDQARLHQNHNRGRNNRALNRKVRRNGWKSHSLT